MERQNQPFSGADFLMLTFEKGVEFEIISIGIVVSVVVSGDELLVQADQSLYQAKSSGHNCYHLKELR